jgi:hypothetical protein
MFGVNQFCMSKQVPLFDGVDEEALFIRIFSNSVKTFSLVHP